MNSGLIILLVILVIGAILYATDKLDFITDLFKDDDAGGSFSGPGDETESESESEPESEEQNLQGTVCTPTGSYDTNATYAYNNTGACTFNECKQGYYRSNNTCKLPDSTTNVNTSPGETNAEVYTRCLSEAGGDQHALKNCLNASGINLDGTPIGG